MKYLVFGSVTGSVMIYGLSFWFGGTGSTLFSELGLLEGSTLIALAGLIAVLIGLGYKAALVPFQFWAPDAYDGAPVSVAAMTFGYLAALVQSNVVRLLAYSSVAQAGYFMMGIVDLGPGSLALPSVIVFGAAYVAMNLGAFAVIMVAGRSLGDFRGFGRARPVIGVAMVVFLLSLTGIPPLFGFVGKVLLFGAAIKAGYLWLAVIGILNSVLALAVYLRIVVPMYQPREAGQDSAALAPPLMIVLGATALVTLFMGLFAGVFPG